MGTEGTVAVVGAELAGLAAAWRLAGAGVRVRVLEAGPHAGGVIRTLRGGGPVPVPHLLTTPLRSLSGRLRIIAEPLSRGTAEADELRHAGAGAMNCAPAGSPDSIGSERAAA